MASKKPASKKKVKIADLPKPAGELTPARANAVRGGAPRRTGDDDDVNDLEIQRLRRR